MNRLLNLRVIKTLKIFKWMLCLQIVCIVFLKNDQFIL